MMLYMADLSKLREQDVNARILPVGDHNTLTNNIRNRGRLESVPYCAKIGDMVEIISGHHRIRSAREAGLTEAPVLIDESGLSRSEIVAKQLAHNRLAGFDDPDTLKRLFDCLDDPALMLASGLSGDMIEVPPVDLETGITPQLIVDWKVVTLTFLPHQMVEFQALIETLPPSDLVGVADVAIYDDFINAAIKFARLKDVRNIGMALALLARIALEQVADEETRQAEEKALEGAKPSSDT